MSLNFINVIGDFIIVIDDFIIVLVTLYYCYW